MFSVGCHCHRLTCIGFQFFLLEMFIMMGSMWSNRDPTTSQISTERIYSIALPISWERECMIEYSDTVWFVVQLDIHKGIMCKLLQWSTSLTYLYTCLSEAVRWWIWLRPSVSLCVSGFVCSVVCRSSVNSVFKQPGYANNLAVDQLLFQGNWSVQNA